MSFLYQAAEFSDGVAEQQAALEWWDEQPSSFRAVCDGCDDEIPRAQGYLVQGRAVKIDDTLAIDVGQLLVCARCFRRNVKLPSRNSLEELPDPVPLGVSGSVTVPLAQFLASGCPERVDVLLSDDERRIYIAGRLAEALRNPLTLRESSTLAASVLSLMPERDELMLRWAQKCLDTLRDGERHDILGASTDEPQVATWFVVWNGSHREVQAERFGEYLTQLLSSAHYLTERGLALAGFLEIDAYVREVPDPDDPCRPLDDVLAIDVECSFLPGTVLGFPQGAKNPLPPMLLVNPDLCSDDERQWVEKLNA